MPEGWYLSRLFAGKRILYYNDIKVAHIIDDFDLESRVHDVINNPPEKIQPALYRDGRISVSELSPKIQRKLVKSGEVTLELANECIPDVKDWINENIPKVAEYSNELYTLKNNLWYDSKGNCINSSKRFQSTWDARVRYAKGECSLTDVARYSWSAMLECLGDEHQRFINQVLNPKLKINKKAWAFDAKQKKEERIEKNRWYQIDNVMEEIEEEYRDKVNSSIYDYFYTSIEKQVQMFTEDCNMPAFKDIRKQVERYEHKVLSEIQSIVPVLGKFRWNSLLRAHEPVFAPRPLSVERRHELYDLIHKVIIGEMSGHEAALYMSSGYWVKIQRESNRYRKYMTQYVPYYSERWAKLSTQNSTFQQAVDYVVNRNRDLIDMGYRPADKLIVSFDYDNCRFAVHLVTKEVHYIGVQGGKYMPDSWLKLKPEQRRKRLNDDVEWEYQEYAIKKYNRLFSYLFNIVHKHWDKAYYYLHDKQVARNKYLRPSPRFLHLMKEKADKYIKSLERGVVTC